ncbi:MAG: sensor histidine kinase [Anaerolineae bacterium]|nr:MAG: sensor histidine kinase [Anaerolineae bacterium]
MHRLIPRTLFGRLLLAFLLVFVVSGGVLVAATELSLPRLYDRHFMMASDPDMGEMPMGGHGRGPDEVAAGQFLNFRAAVEGALIPAAWAALLAAILVSAWLSRRVSQPLQHLAQASQRIAVGHYEQRVSPTEISGAPQEFVDVAGSFNQMAERLEKTETLRRELIADVSHELRTPLTIIKGSMEGLMDGVLAPDNQTFGMVQHEAARLERLVNDMLQLSRLEAGKDTLELGPLSVETLLNGSLESIRAAYREKGVSLASELEQGLPALQVDVDRAYQAVLNLLANALEYTPAGGVVTVRARRESESIVIEVEDSGIGIAPGHLPHVFERFYRVDKSRSRAQGGTGIGLAITRRIMEAHGGRAEVTSPGLGHGSRFTLIWPIEFPPNPKKQ